MPSPSPPPPEITITTINGPTPTTITISNTTTLTTTPLTIPQVTNDVSRANLITEPVCSNSDEHRDGVEGANCYNSELDDEIRSRLDKLNALSDLINSLERQFDDANSVFRETLKCSTDRLSSIAKALGKKSIKQGRVYNAAKLSVEQSQSDCRKACVQFEQANKDHQVAKNAIKEAELKLMAAGGQKLVNGTKPVTAGTNIGTIDISKLNLHDHEPSQALGSEKLSINHSLCDNNIESSSTTELPTSSNHINFPARPTTFPSKLVSDPKETHIQNGQCDEKLLSPNTVINNNAAILSEELNQAITRLIEAERIRGQSQRQHMDRANKLMLAQETLMKLERDHGPSIRRSQLYFDEAKRFNAKLNSVKGDICRINEDIIAAKQAYAQTLSELEQFSDDLHVNSETSVS